MVSSDISASTILLVVGMCAPLECSVGLGIVFPAETVIMRRLGRRTVVPSRLSATTRLARRRR